LNKTRNYKSYL